MKILKYYILLLLLLGCKKPFSQIPETALALPTEIKKTTTSIVFITGYDEGNNTYYHNAEIHFKAQGLQIVNSLFSLTEIIQWLNRKNNIKYDEIHIVSHSNAWLGMSLKTTKEGKRITVESLLEAKKKIPTLKKGITNNTKIIFHSCGLGENKDLLRTLKQFFTTEETPKIIASSYFNVFGGKFAGHYLAKPYYGYYPTAESPGPMQLAKEFKRAYPNTSIPWFSALKTRQETNLGKVYSYKFNIPVNWEFTFDNKTEIPQLPNKEAIMDWISESPEMAEVLYNLHIPIEKYRWKSKISGNTLVIKGKTTVLCVLEPILQEKDTTEYKPIKLDDNSLYKIL